MWRLMRHYGTPLKIVSTIRSLYDAMTCLWTTYHPLLLSLLELDRVVYSQQWSFRCLSTGCSIKPWNDQEACSGPLLRRWRTWILQTSLVYFPSSSNKYKSSHNAWAQLHCKQDLKINTHKTKSMRVNTATNTPIQMAEQHIEDVESFTYLGSIIICHPEASLKQQEHPPQDQADHLQLQCEVCFVIRFRDMEAHQSTRLETSSFCEHLPTKDPPYKMVWTISRHWDNCTFPSQLATKKMFYKLLETC